VPTGRLRLWSQRVYQVVRRTARLGLDPGARVSPLGLALSEALWLACVGVVLVSYLPQNGLVGIMLLGGAIGGCALAALQRHPVRKRGLATLGSLCLVAALVWCALFSRGESELPPSGGFLLGFSGAVVAVPLCTRRQAALPAGGRRKGVAALNDATVIAVVAAIGLIQVLWMQGVLTKPQWQFGSLAVLALLGAIAFVSVYFREMVECIIEWAVWPIYRIRAHGPGAHIVPLKGPLLIVSNHTSYADIFFLGKVTPRSLVPMMTSVFYDLPFIRWWMVRVVHTIRVEAATFRREAPELKEAVERLRQGQCLVIFPEARLRSREDVLLRPFGQGVWHILREAPETVVVPFWIEGGWGSWSSYFKGPPMKNKRFDLWRPINIGIGEPAPLPQEVLKDHRSTREYLHAACLACREYVGLPAAGGKKHEVGAGEDL
jgi:1-acyl-sn-glycerol-3-phosphate acyltransferase